MKLIFDLVSFLLRTLIVPEAVVRFRRRGILVYLKTLQVVRAGLAGAIAVFFIMQMMIVGFAGALIAGIWLLPIEQQIKLWILFGIFSAFFFIPVIALLFLFSERVWYVASGAHELVEQEAQRSVRKDQDFAQSRSQNS